MPVAPNGRMTVEVETARDAVSTRQEVPDAIVLQERAVRRAPARTMANLDPARDAEVQDVAGMIGVARSQIAGQWRLRLCRSLRARLFPMIAAWNRWRGRSK